MKKLQGSRREVGLGSKKFSCWHVVLRCQRCIQKVPFNGQLFLLFLGSEEQAYLDLVTQAILSYERSEEMSLVEGRRQEPRKIQYHSNQGRERISKRMGDGGDRDSGQDCQVIFWGE